MQLANFFSMNRLVLAPVFFAVYFLPDYFHGSEVVSVCISVPLFIYMGLTDFLDGFCARKYGQVSDFGKLFDPFADVLTNLTVFFTFAIAGPMPAFFFVVVLFREMGMQFVRMLAIRNGVVIAAKMSGKIKTVAYIISSGFSLFIVSLFRLNGAFHFFDPEWFDSLVSRLTDVNNLLYAVAVILSVKSFVGYLRSFKDVLKTPRTDSPSN